MQPNPISVPSNNDGRDASLRHEARPLLMDNCRRRGQLSMGRVGSTYCAAMHAAAQSTRPACGSTMAGPFPLSPLWPWEGKWGKWRARKEASMLDLPTHLPSRRGEGKVPMRRTKTGTPICQGPQFKGERIREEGRGHAGCRAGLDKAGQGSCIPAASAAVAYHPFVSEQKFLFPTRVNASQIEL